jgi:RNA polymerase sigma factor (sigma-70 family)
MEKSVCSEEVYDGIYRIHCQKLRNYLYYKCGDLAVAEDLAQESFVRLWLNCAKVLYEKATGFLYTVANNLFLDQARSKKVSLRFEKNSHSGSDHQDPFFYLRSDEFRNILETTISQLPDAQREAFLLNRIDKYTYKEIASLLKISETAVEKRITKALLRLKERIDEFKSYQI